MANGDLVSRHVCKLYVMGDKQYKPGDSIELDDADAAELVRLGYLEPAKAAEPEPVEAVEAVEPEPVEDDKPKSEASAKGKK